MNTLLPGEVSEENALITKDEMARFAAGEGELHATIHVKRKETGVVETYNIVGSTKPRPKVHGSSGALAADNAKVTT